MYNCKFLQENVTKKEETFFTIILHAESKEQNNIHRVQRVIVVILELSVDLLSKPSDFLAFEREMKYSDVTMRSCAGAPGIHKDILVNIYTNCINNISCSN